MASQRYRFGGILLLAFAQVMAGETFECQTGWLWIDDYEIILVATVDDDGKTGTIKVSGVSHKTVYGVEGINREWDWGRGSDGYEYRFVLEPNGSGHFLDFTGAEKGEWVEASQHFVCKQKFTKAEAEERRSAARNSSEMAAYQFAIAQKIRRSWAVPASASDETRCTARVTQRWDGMVESVNIIYCNGDEAVQRSVEAAIRRASPLPEAPNRDLFDRELTLNLTLERDD